MAMGKIDDTFISYASSILTKNNQGMSREEIIEHCNHYALNYNVTIPITSPDVGEFASAVLNRYTALYKNLSAFDGQQQFDIIKSLCELPQFENDDNVQRIKKKLSKQYARFALAPLFLEKYPLTDWERVDQALDEMKTHLDAATSPEAFQAIGASARETLNIIARQVYDAEKHPTTDDSEVVDDDVLEAEAAAIEAEAKAKEEAEAAKKEGKDDKAKEEAAEKDDKSADDESGEEESGEEEEEEKPPRLVHEAKAINVARMLKAYLKHELTEGAEMALPYASLAIDLAHKLTEHENATRREASICLISVISVASLIKTVEETEKQVVIEDEEEAKATEAKGK